MVNSILMLSFLIFLFSTVIVVYYFYGVMGLIAILVIVLVFANIAVNKLITLFGLEVTLGNVLYATSFLITDILGEVHGKKYSQKAVGIGFITMILSLIISQVILGFVPSVEDSSQAALSQIFSIFYRILLASSLAYIIAQLNDIFIFHYFKNKHKKAHLWLRNNVSTLISQSLDSVIFVFIAFYGVFDISILFQILITTFLIKAIIAILDTPFIYLARKVAYMRQYIR